jgi:predicted nucleic acid-binding Zn ribbon protein
VTDGPERLSEVLSRLFTSRGWGQRQDRLRIEEAWHGTVGELVAPRTEVGALRRGVLEVIVADAILLQELAGFDKRRILQGLQERLGPKRVTDVRFRLGTVNEAKGSPGAGG